MNANNPFATRLAAAAAATRGSARRDGLDTVAPADRSEAIAMHFTAPAAADVLTDRQEALIQALLTERDVYTEKRPKYIDRISALWTPADRADMTRPQASAFIEYLFTLPMKARKHATDALIPEGLYAVEIDIEGLIFVKVDHGSGKWDGYTFVTRQVGSDFVRVNRRVADAAQAAIRKVGFKESSIRYGLELGHCGRCGRELTNEASREAGIGPICAGKDW